MFRRYKTLILFVVLAAMSLRGMAAVDTWHCAHGQPDAIFSAGHVAHEHAAPTDGDPGMPAHAGHGEDAPADPGHSPGPHPASHCISSAVAPTDPVSLAFVPVTAGRIPFLGTRFAGIVPPLAERPPLPQPL